MPTLSASQRSGSLVTSQSRNSRDHMPSLLVVAMATRKYNLCFLIACIYNMVTSAPTPLYLELDVPTIEEVSFLKKYGYMMDGLNGMEPTYSLQETIEAVKRMQAFAGLPQTGSLDSATRSLFHKKRCGVRDIEVRKAGSRRRRYIVHEAWNKRSISYKVYNGSSTLEKSHIEKLMASALEVWAPHGKLHFYKVDDGKADIQVSFASYEHGDGFPFDGRGHVVAHAYGPPFGEMHFDDDEIWTDDPDSEEPDITEFYAVAVHEIGHALGLSHSDDKSSVMYPYYQLPVNKLGTDDVLAIQELYLKDIQLDVDATEDPFLSRSSLEPHYTKADSEEFVDDVPDICYANYDTVQVIQGKIYVFEEEWMWVLSDRRKIEEGYPKRFHEVFVGLPRNLNVVKTIYEKRNGNIVIFSEQKYWEFDYNFQYIQKGKLTDYSLPPTIQELQTVFVSNYNNKTYLIEYEKFWRYDEDENKMDAGYPKEMSAWRKLPFIEAAFIWKGDTFFFRGPRFWRFDNENIQAHEYYPLPTAQVWFPCNSTADMYTFTSNDRP